MSFSSSARSSVVGCLLSAGWAAGLTGARAVFSVWAKQFTFSKRRFPINRNAARSLRPRRRVAKLIRAKPQVMDISTLFTLPRAALLKSHEEPLLCATSVFSVSLWCAFAENSSTTETQRTQRLHREIQVSTTCDSGWVHSHQGPSTSDLAHLASNVRIIVVSNDSSFLR